MSELIPKTDIRIVKFDGDNIITDHESFTDFEELVESNENMYPGIDKWFQKKVIPGIRTAERVAYIAYADDIPVISAIVKKGDSSKFCHLKISESFQNSSFGDLFFTLMAFEVRKIAEEIHFTLPESLWELKKDFFKSFGFDEFTEASDQYRLFETELLCSASLSKVWECVMKKIPKLKYMYTIGGFSTDNGLVFSIHHQHAKNIMLGKKRVEIRRRFSKKWINHRIAIYATDPARSIVGEATIFDVDKGEPTEIWEKYGHDISCTEKEFYDYSKGTKILFAIILGDVKPYPAPIFLSQLAHILKSDLRPPQSYYTMKKNEEWATAISISSLLFGGRMTTRDNQNQSLNLVYI